MTSRFSAQAALNRRGDFRDTINIIHGTSIQGFVLHIAMTEAPIRPTQSQQ
jgi:hypothetical protein